jgi:hypothetical protein
MRALRRSSSVGGLLGLSDRGGDGDSMMMMLLMIYCDDALCLVPFLSVIR